MGLANALLYRSLRLTPAPSARRRGSNGEAEARIHLKIKIIISSQPTKQHSSYKQKQSAEGAVFDGGAFGCLQTESAYNKKNARFINLASAFGVEDGARTHDKKSSYSTHYQQVATATFKHLQIGLQIRTQLLLFEQRYTKIRK